MQVQTTQGKTIFLHYAVTPPVWLALTQQFFYLKRTLRPMRYDKSHRTHAWNVYSTFPPLFLRWTVSDQFLNVQFHIYKVRVDRYCHCVRTLPTPTPSPSAVFEMKDAVHRLSWIPEARLLKCFILFTAILSVVLPIVKDAELLRSCT